MRTFVYNSVCELHCGNLSETTRDDPAASNQKCKPQESGCVCFHSRSLIWRLCGACFHSQFNNVSSRKEAVFHGLSVCWICVENVRWSVRQAGHQQGWEGGCVRAESRPGRYGHQDWERSSSGRATDTVNSIYVGLIGRDSWHKYLM